MRMRKSAVGLLCAFMATLAVLVFTIVRCNSSGTSPTSSAGSPVTITRNSAGIIEATFTAGEGTYTVPWYNNKTRTEYDFAITAGTAGSARIIIRDNDDDPVVNVSLSTSLADSLRVRTGLSAPGAAGNWSIDFVLTGFNGTGSFSCVGAD